MVVFLRTPLALVLLAPLLLLAAAHDEVQRAPPSLAGSVGRHPRAVDPGMCHRAGGQHPALDATTAPFETPAACAARGCEHRAGACRYKEPTTPTTNITTVHLIQSNHLDVGYTDTARGVINLYFDTFFPRAIKVGAELRATAADNAAANAGAAGGGAGGERLRWMTQTYLVTLFLDCPPGLGLHCPDAAAVAAFEGAVVAGDITWQAFPHNAELMMLDPGGYLLTDSLTHLRTCDHFSVCFLLTTNSLLLVSTLLTSLLRVAQS